MVSLALLFRLSPHATTAATTPRSYQQQQRQGGAATVTCAQTENVVGLDSGGGSSCGGDGCGAAADMSNVCVQFLFPA